MEETYTLTDMLALTYALLAEVGWTRHTFARTEDGLSVCPYDSSAASYCIWGAITLALATLGLQHHGTIKQTLSDALTIELPKFIGLWNDEASDVSVILRAIEDWVEDLYRRRPRNVLLP